VTIAWRHASKAASHSRPGSRSPAFASSMIFWTMASRVGLTTPVRMLEGHKGHLESDAQETGGLGVKPVALQVVPDRHG
jgi:hypothetical protein